MSLVIANLHGAVSVAVETAFGVKPDLFVHKNVRICRSCFTVKDGDLIFFERTGWKLLLLRLFLLVVIEESPKVANVGSLRKRKEALRECARRPSS